MAKSSRPRKLLMAEGSHPGTAEISFSDERWAEVRGELPANISAEFELELRSLVQACCNSFLSRLRQIRSGAAAAASIRRGGGKQAAPFEHLQSSLRMAINALEGMKDLQDPMLNLHRRRLEEMLQDVTRRAAQLHSQSPISINPRHELVRSLAKACTRFGLAPSATGRIYDEEAHEPSWFQKFVAALNDNLLGTQGWGAIASYSRNALYADVVKAMREQS
jgi:hypothetical protein